MTERCPICEDESGVSLSQPMEMPILMNRIYATAEEGRSAARGTLDFVSCRRCGFTWNRAFDPSLIKYDKEYENDQSWSPAFRAHMKARVVDILQSVGDDRKVNYLEVGCGQGRFIEEVVEVAGERLCSAYGFDPAWRGEEGSGPSGSHIYRRLFDIEAEPLLSDTPNIVVSRHTIEHVSDPVGFLSSVRAALGAKSRATIWIETPCVTWIFRHRAMQDFFYEHCSLFTARSLAHALEKSGFARPRVQHVFGDQYLWAEAVASDCNVAKSVTVHQDHASLANLLSEFTNSWRPEIARAAEAGPVALWGAGAKGVSFSIIVDPKCELIDHVVDVNPHKQGHYLPGSGLPVVSPEGSAARSPHTIYVMNPNYMDEISATVREVGLSAKLISVD